MENDTDQDSEPQSGSIQVVTVRGKEESRFKRFLKAILGTETRFGRGFRVFLRWTALGVGMFALGLLSGYLLLYKPVLEQIADLNSSAEQAQAELSNTQTDLDTTRSKFSQADQERQDLKEQINQLEAHLNLLTIKDNVAQARMYLALEDNTSAKQILNAASDPLDELSSYATAIDSEAFGAILSRLSLAISEIPSDTKTAASDLSILTQQLTDLEETLFSTSEKDAAEIPSLCPRYCDLD